MLGVRELLNKSGQHVQRHSPQVLPCAKLALHVILSNKDKVRQITSYSSCILGYILPISRMKDHTCEESHAAGGVSIRLQMMVLAQSTLRIKHLQGATLHRQQLKLQRKPDWRDTGNRRHSQMELCFGWQS